MPGYIICWQFSWNWVPRIYVSSPAKPKSWIRTFAAPISTSIKWVTITASQKNQSYTPWHAHYHRSSEGIHLLHEKTLGSFSCSFSSTHIILKTDAVYVIKSVFTLIFSIRCIATPSHLVKMFILGVIISLACNFKHNFGHFFVL